MKLNGNRERLGYIEGFVSIVINLLLFILKFWAGVVSGSVALIADAWHTLSDSLSSIVVVIGVKLASKKPDKEHPFGHGRWEQISAILIAFLLTIVAYELARESIEKFNLQEGANFGKLAIIVTVISIVVKEGLAQYAFWAGRKTGNSSIRADGWHHRSDAVSSVIVLVGILFKSKFWWIDSVLGISISLMLFYAVYDIMKEAINKLLGEVPSPELIDKIKKLIYNLEKKEIYAHHFHIHNYGKHKELTFHIKLDEELDIKTCHEMATRIEYKIFEEFNIDATIHIESIAVAHQ